MSKRSSFPRWGVWLLGGLGFCLAAVLIVLAVVWMKHGDKDERDGNKPSAESRKPVASMDAGKFAAEFEQNEGGADMKYKDKVVQLSGLAARVHKDERGRYYLSEPYGLRAAHGFGTMENQAPALPLVYCYLADSAGKRVADLAPDEQVTVRGFYRTTKATPGTLPEFYIVLEECSLVR